MFSRLMVLFVVFTLALSARAQSEYVGEQASRIFHSISAPVTRYSSADHTYVVFVKETDWMKCSAYALGDESEPTPLMSYRCEMKAVVY